jgi:hypothetical protein
VFEPAHASGIPGDWQEGLERHVTAEGRVMRSIHLTRGPRAESLEHTVSTDDPAGKRAARLDCPGRSDMQRTFLVFRRGAGGIGADERQDLVEQAAVTPALLLQERLALVGRQRECRVEKPVDTVPAA